MIGDGLDRMIEAAEDGRSLEVLAQVAEAEARELELLIAGCADDATWREEFGDAFQRWIYLSRKAREKRAALLGRLA